MVTKATRPGVMYLVQRQSFHESGGYCIEPQAGGNNGARVPLRLFPTRAAAEAYKAELEAAARRRVNPFRFLGSPDDMLQPAGPEGVDVTAAGRAWVAGLRALGLKPPRLDGEGWEEAADWWDRTAPTLSDEQLAAAWRVFDGFRLFEVVEIESA